MPEGTVVIQPGFDPAYCQYPILGFEKLFGPSHVCYRRTPGVPASDHPNVLLASVRVRGESRTIAIDLRDQSSVSESLISSVSVYGKTNIRPEDVDDRVVAIGPTFGVSRSWAAYRLAQVRHAGLKSGRLFQRVPLSAYGPVPSMDHYVFYIAWPWSKHPEVTELRARVVRELGSLPIEFEGGFVPLGRFRPRPATGLEHLSAPRQYRHRDFVRRTQLSAFAVNTAAVHDCLGWKLGEFLAMGKACVSTRLTRAMPGQFMDGEHVHLVGDLEEMSEAFELLLANSDYRRHLEEGARRYWEHYLEPSALVARLVDIAFERGPA